MAKAELHLSDGSTLIDNRRDVGQRQLELANASTDDAVLTWPTDAGAALRFVRALGYYWVQCGYGEADALTRDVLAMALASTLHHPWQDTQFGIFRM